MGNNFNSTAITKCKFGNKVVPGVYIDANNIQCVAPAANNSGPVELSISQGDDNFGNSIRFTYYAVAEISSISPICGPRTGYTQITVKGKNFVSINPELVRCNFGEFEQTLATIISETEIACDSPDIHLKPYKNSFFNFSVTLNGNDKSSAVQFGFYDFHSLTKLSPLMGPVSGFTTVDISGYHFLQKAVCNVTVRFGTTEVPAVSYNDTDIIVKTPETGTEGKAIVQVSLNGQQFTDYAGPFNLGGSKFDNGKLEFYYFGNPLTTGFSPLGGPSSGNSLIEIFGAGFGEEGDSVFLRFKNKTNNAILGLVKCDQVEINKVKCLTPRVRPGSHAYLELSRNGQNFISVANYTYFFYESPTITSISPNIGPVKNDVGGNITITGTNFKCTTQDCSQLTCKYGTDPYPLYVKGYYIDTNHVYCPIISYSRPEVIEIEISLNEIDYTNDNQKYTFFDAFVLNADPKFFSEQGGTVVSVLGFGFADTGSEIQCKLGSNNNPLLCGGSNCIFSGVFISDSEIQCTMPPSNTVTYQNTGNNILYDQFAIEVSIKGSVFTTSNIQVMYIQNPEYQTLNTLSGTANGLTPVIIPANFNWNNSTMETILTNANVSCRFFTNKSEVFMEGNIIVYPFLSTGNPNAVSCLTPPWPKSETVNLQITINGKDYFGSFSYKFLDKLEGSLISPTCGPDSGETKVSIQGTGFNDLSNLHLKWGTETRPANQESLFSESSGYISGYSPSTRFNNTHGGFVYVEIGHNIDLQTANNTTYTISEYTRDKLLYLYYFQPVLSYIYPRAGSSSGGTIITFSGANFINYETIGCTP